MELIKKISLALAIIGGINWGLIGLFDINLVNMIFKGNIIENIVYIIVGISSLICLAYFFEMKND